VGVIEAEQTENGKTFRNDRLIAVVETPYHAPRYESLDEIDDQRLDEIERFFVSYN
jgi:inorganic pyrophosphatase